jgi:hypothetical protein
MRDAFAEQPLQGASNYSAPRHSFVLIESGSRDILQDLSHNTCFRGANNFIKSHPKNTSFTKALCVGGLG